MLLAVCLPHTNGWMRRSVPSHRVARSHPVVRQLTKGAVSSSLSLSVPPAGLFQPVRIISFGSNEASLLRYEVTPICMSPSLFSPSTSLVHLTVHTSVYFARGYDVLAILPSTLTCRGPGFDLPVRRPHTNVKYAPDSGKASASMNDAVS